MGRVVLRRPFTQGMVTDMPGHELGPQTSTFAQDGFSPNGVFKQRQGWEFDGTTADVADNLTSVFRAQFVLADVTRSVTGDDDGDLFVHNASASGTAIFTGTVEYLPRCIYRDELMFCAQDGTTPLRRYSGSDDADLSLSSTPAAFDIVNARLISSGAATISPAPDSGSYVVWRSATSKYNIPTYVRVLESNTTGTDWVTLEDVNGPASGYGGTTGGTVSATGLTAACVGFYSAGTAEAAGAGGGITGYGTKWSTGGITISTHNDAILFLPSGANAQYLNITSVTDDDTINGGGGDNGAISTSPYTLLRRCPFKDAASHKESLFGTGVAQYPSRVFISPPGWNPSFPPGYTLPFNPGRTSPLDPWVSTNANDFLLDFIDVPSSYDGDDNIAILSSPNPLLVLKRNAIYGIFGSYPNFAVDLVADGVGCIDIRSAHSLDEGQFWAGEEGIYWYTGGRIVDLTAGRINREWRNLTRDFDYGTSDYCTLGVSQGHLVVHITTGGGATQRTYLCNLGDGSWQSRVSNFNPRYLYSSRIPGESEKLLAVTNDSQGRVIDFSPALDGSGTAADDSGSAPRLKAYTTEGLSGEGIDEDTRILDLAIHANVYDAGAAGSTSMAVSVVSQDALTAGATATKTLDSVDSDTTDRLDRHYFRSVNRRGRRHQLRLEVDTLGTDDANTKVEVHEIDATFRGGRSRT